MDDEVKKSRIPRRGAPTADSRTEPEHLNDRIRNFCDMVLRGMPSAVAGLLVTPSAGKQQVDAWLRNEAVQKYLRQHGKKVEEIFQREQNKILALKDDLLEQALLRLIGEVKDGKNVKLTFLYDIIKDALITQTTPPEEARRMPNLRDALEMVPVQRIETPKKKGFGGRYNERACEWFDKFDEVNNTKGKYGSNGGEQTVGDFRVDYYNEELKLIFEWDEEYHYVDGKLRPGDVKRQKEIEDLCPDFRVVRIREEKADFNKLLRLGKGDPSKEK